MKVKNYLLEGDDVNFMNMSEVFSWRIFFDILRYWVVVFSKRD